MKARTLHRSTAIKVSKHANIKNPEVKKLSERIIASHENEIADMEAIIE